MGIKMAQQIIKWAQKTKKTSISCSSLLRPLFPRNHSNYRAVRTSWLSKGYLFNGDWLICCFGCVFLCSVLYNIFYRLLFHKASVNAEPFIPPFFEETAAHKKYMLFSHFCVCVCF
jgi:hypothetical protein